MTTRLAIKQDQIRAGIKAAAKEGCLCEIDLKNGVMRFIHSNPQDTTLDASNADKSNSLAKWQEKANGKG